MKALILAAGRGKRLADYTKGTPKCLLKIGNESLLEREIRLLKENGFSSGDIYVVGGYKYEMLKGIAPNLIINPEYDTKDNSYSVALGLKEIDDDVLIMDSDLCFEAPLIKEIMEDNHANVLLSKKSKDLDESTGIVTDLLGRVSAIGKAYQNTGYVYISIFKIQKEIRRDFIRELLDEQSEKTWYPLAITKLCGKYEFYNHVTNEKWHEIDFVEDYKETLQLFHQEAQ